VTASSNEHLADTFEQHRTHLRGVAFRMLGSLTEADDAVQEAWLRLSRADTDQVDNLRAWLTTVVARVSLDMLRSRRSKREDALDDENTGTLDPPAPGADPEQEAVMADAVGLALLVVLDTLAPPERLAFVLHDMFAVPFEEIAPLVGRSPAAARQLASRARRRVRGARTDPAQANQREIVDRFLAALRAGDFEALLAVLDPDVVVRLDRAAVRAGAPTEIRGARQWAAGAIAFSRQARFVQPALIDNGVGLILAPRGRLMRAMTVKVAAGRIVEVDIVADDERLRRLDLKVLHDR
jgi:RNA polymerase sigma-70 factor, ECF subfamily